MEAVRGWVEKVTLRWGVATGLKEGGSKEIMAGEAEEKWAEEGFRKRKFDFMREAAASGEGARDERVDGWSRAQAQDVRIVMEDGERKDMEGVRTVRWGGIFWKAGVGRNEKGAKIREGLGGFSPEGRTDHGEGRVRGGGGGGARPWTGRISSLLHWRGGELRWQRKRDPGGSCG